MLNGWRNKIVVLSFVPMAFGIANAHASTFLTGNQLLEWCSVTPSDESYYIKNGSCMAYVMGVADLWTTAWPRTVCMPSAVNAKQVADTVTGYLKDKPEGRHRGADVLVSEALIEAFRCG
jgi:hypothetical protein